MKREGFLYGAGYLFFVLIFMTPMGMALKRELDEERALDILPDRHRIEAGSEQLSPETIGQISEKDGVATEEAVPSILRGTTGQAKLVGIDCVFQSVVSLGAGCFGDESGPWSCPQDPWTSRGWSITADGTVTVPVDANARRYHILYNSGEFCLNEQNDGGWEIYKYEFETVSAKD